MKIVIFEALTELPDTLFNMFCHVGETKSLDKLESILDQLDYHANENLVAGFIHEDVLTEYVGSHQDFYNTLTGVSIKHVNNI